MRKQNENRNTNFETNGKSIGTADYLAGTQTGRRKLRWQQMWRQCFIREQNRGMVWEPWWKKQQHRGGVRTGWSGLESSSENLVTEEGITVPGFRANLRETDNQVLGVVSDRYKVVQNEEAFAFTDELLGEGVTYETAGSLQNGRRTWI